MIVGKRPLRRHRVIVHHQIGAALNERDGSTLHALRRQVALGSESDRKRPFSLTTNVAAVTVPVCAPITSRQLNTTFCSGRRNAVARNMYDADAKCISKI